jgi:regulator of protease activity HflC (stomatin/prohibitin superfamily)
MPTTMDHPVSSSTRETEGSSLPGLAMLVMNILWVLVMLALTFRSLGRIHDNPGQFGWSLLFSILAVIVGLFALRGYFALQPNEARVLILFGNYNGTVRRSGFHWVNPFCSRRRNLNAARAVMENTRRVAQKDAARSAQIDYSASSTRLSLRAHNFNSETLKVNDKRGNPVEIGAVVVWRVQDTAQAVFDVEDYKSYVQVQSEAAIRGIATRFAYDHGEQHEPTLRGSTDEVAQALQEELQVRLTKAGVVVDEARLTHLAYAPEIASVMLRRQQAEAIVAARQQIVQGAVGMVRTALQELSDQHVVELDPERKAAMVSNLLVVLCGNADASPVINTGTLYT